MKEIRLLSHGIFEKPFMDSRAKTRRVSTKEKILGHLVGPLGLIFVVNTIAALVEKFFTQQTGVYANALGASEGDAFLKLMSGQYEAVMLVAKILAIFMGLFIGWLVQHTKSRQGRMRPWLLIFGFLSIAIGFLIFLFNPSTLGSAYWYYFFVMVVCYNTIGCSYFYVWRDTIVSITTRDPTEKMQLKFIRQLCWTLISGIIIGMLVSSVLLPFWLDKDVSGYPILMIALSVAAIPLLLMEYFYTRERVIEDVVEEKGVEGENKIPLKEQLKALFKNKYFMILFALATIGGIVDNFKGGNVQYFYIKFLLGAGESGKEWIQSIYPIITGVPLGIGAFAIYPLAKKFGIRNVSLVGYSLVLIGSLLGFFFPSNLYIAFGAGFIRQLGFLPNAYIFATLMCYAYDSIEYKSHLRLEGLMGVSIFVAVQSGIYAPFAGGYESILLSLGFRDAAGYVASQDVLNFMTISMYLFDAVMAACYVIGLLFVDVEKHLPEINAGILAERKAAVLAQGKEWVEPEVLAEREEAEFAREAEEARVADLKDKCARKGLDYEAENAKYLASKAEKERKTAEKKARKEAKKKAR
jgi:GPH family glycoside/pentoside/hexuronide:cation symporter